jgi:hypothetical protein
LFAGSEQITIINQIRELKKHSELSYADKPSYLGIAKSKNSRKQKMKREIERKKMTEIYAHVSNGYLGRIKSPLDLKRKK